MPVVRVRHDRLLREQAVEMFERGCGYGVVPTVVVPWFPNNLACNSPGAISNIELRSLELQRLQGMLKFKVIELHAKFWVWSVKSGCGVWDWGVECEAEVWGGRWRAASGR